MRFFNRPLAALLLTWLLWPLAWFLVLFITTWSGQCDADNCGPGMPLWQTVLWFIGLVAPLAGVSIWWVRSAPKES